MIEYLQGEKNAKNRTRRDNETIINDEVNNNAKKKKKIDNKTIQKKGGKNTNK